MFALQRVSRSEFARLEVELHVLCIDAVQSGVIAIGKLHANRRRVVAQPGCVAKKGGMSPVRRLSITPMQISQ
jgi:hypothetical protein